MVISRFGGYRIRLIGLSGSTFPYPKPLAPLGIAVDARYRAARYGEIAFLGDFQGFCPTTQFT